MAEFFGGVPLHYPSSFFNYKMSPLEFLWLEFSVSFWKLEMRVMLVMLVLLSLLVCWTLVHRMLDLPVF